MQRNTENTYWNHNGLWESAAAVLQEMIPSEGAVRNPQKNKHLERLRKAINIYYDLYNNGLWNRRQGFYRIFGFRCMDYYRSWENGFTPELYKQVELVMNGLIELAAVEQNVPLEKNPNHSG